MGRSRRAESWEPMRRVIGDMREGPYVVLAKDGGRVGQSEATREGVEGINRTDEAVKANEEVEGDSDCCDRRKYEEAG